ncbi:hypothetical protein [Nesterenkonia lutea]|uniref:Uncharacterized protein n=1 Tax=Nesterenkonia lutea TaxID=272919 RepID=A0ABR9JHK2_9MICC|nr:hypothetical protein [Nesterenkonia lutea]MBE1525311.1 hypothetical protein [Nesterenkonia lutea]
MNDEEDTFTLVAFFAGAAFFTVDVDAEVRVSVVCPDFLPVTRTESFLPTWEAETL